MASNAAQMTSDLADWTRAVDTTNRMLSLNKSLASNVEAVVSVARRADEIEPKNDIERELQQSMKDLCNTGEDVMAMSRALTVREKELDGIIKQAHESKTADMGTVENCLKKLEMLLDDAKTLNNSLVDFQKNIESAKQVCERLKEKHEQEKERLKEEAKFRKAAGIAGATMCGVGAVALGIAGLFTFGTTWIGAAALGTAAVGAAGSAVAIGVMSHFDLKKLNQQVDELHKVIAKLDGQIKELEHLPKNMESNLEVLDNIKISIQHVLNQYKEKQEKVKLEEENRMLKAKVAETEDKMRKKEQGHLEREKKMQEEILMLRRQQAKTEDKTGDARKE